MKRFQKVASCSVFLMLILTLGIDILFKKLNTTHSGFNVETLCTLSLRGREFHAKPVFFLNVFSGSLYFDALIKRLF